MVTRVKNEGIAKGRRGVAELIRISESKARIDFPATEKEPAASFQIDVSFGEEGTIPDYVPFKKIKDKSKFPLSATMDEAGKRILYAVPANGYFEAEFDKFVAKKDETPCPETKKSTKGNKTYRDFAAMIKVTGGDWQGLKIKEGCWLGAQYYYRMYDNFADDGNGFLAVKGSGSGSDSLCDFLDATIGGATSQIEFSENPLPEIEKIAQDVKNTFNINVAKGWIASIVVPLSLDAGEEIGFLEEEGVPEALKETE